VLQHSHEVLALAWAPSGKLLASATLDGQIYLWNPLEAELQVCPLQSSQHPLTRLCSKPGPFKQEGPPHEHPTSEHMH
jgi:WD40 repeat protein